MPGTSLVRHEHADLDVDADAEGDIDTDHEAPSECPPGYVNGAGRVHPVDDQGLMSVKVDVKAGFSWTVPERVFTIGEGGGAGNLAGAAGILGDFIGGKSAPDKPQ